MDARDVSLAAIFAGLYSVFVIALAPISFGPVQLRVADCLIPFAALFGGPVIAGVTLGGFLGNAYFWLGPHDVVLGPIANLIAATLIFLLRRRQFLACVVGALPIGIIVGSYLWLFFPPPDIFGLSLRDRLHSSKDLRQISNCPTFDSTRTESCRIICSGLHETF
jgi:hypothetical protein